MNDDDIVLTTSLYTDGDFLMSKSNISSLNTPTPLFTHEFESEIDYQIIQSNQIEASEKPHEEELLFTSASISIESSVNTEAQNENSDGSVANDFINYQESPQHSMDSETVESSKN